MCFWKILSVVILSQVFSVSGIQSKDERIIRCFDCSLDMRNRHCDDRFNTIGVVVKNCSGSCVKVKIYTEGENKVFGRYCSSKKENEQCRQTDTGGGQRMEDCYCNTDLCNNVLFTKYDKFYITSALLLCFWSFAI